MAKKFALHKKSDFRISKNILLGPNHSKTGSLAAILLFIIQKLKPQKNLKCFCFLMFGIQI